MRTPHPRRVRTTRSWAGAHLAVTSAVRIGVSVPASSRCKEEITRRKFASGPSFSGQRARLLSLSSKAASPCFRKTSSASSEKRTASPSKAMRIGPGSVASP